MTAHKNQQIIDFDESDESWPTFVYSKNVTVYPSSRTCETDSKASNKITTQNVVDYSWEDRYTLGHLISYHPHTKLVAYVLSISNNYMIRVLNEENSSRCLIKEFAAEITDIGFSKSKTPYIASIDVNGSVKINKMILNMEVLECQVVLHIKASPIENLTIPKISYSRVMWCCRSDVDEVAAHDVETTGTNISLLLGIVHGATFEVLQVDTVESELSGIGVLYDGKVDREGLKLIASSFQEQYADSDSLSDLFLPYLCHTAPGDGACITSLAISNDAAAFAVALQDGAVHFFTLDGSASSGLKEAYSWRPFDGDVVWSLLFLDDCRPGSCTDSFWCHVVVGGAFNRQLKLFRCDKWDCVQTVTFNAHSVPFLMSAHVDQSARFLIMSDIRRKVLYLLEIDSVDEGTTKLFKSVQEFVLTQPLLSFDINSIVCTPCTDGSQQVVMKLFTITKSAFQKMRVTYITKGHRLNEIVVTDDDGDDYDKVIHRDNICGSGSGALSHHSLLTQVTVPSSVSRLAIISSLDQVSSLPSAASSFQDPAIISTQMHKDFPCVNLSSEVPPTLQHLFSSASAKHKDVVPNNNQDNSGDESDDDASIDDLGIILNQRCTDKFNDEEESGFPLPPCATNGNWNSDLVNIGHYPPANTTTTTTATTNKDHKSVDNMDRNDRSDEKLSRIFAMMELQRREIESLTRCVREMRDNIQTCNCRESRQVWTDHAAKEVGDCCQRAVSAHMGQYVRDSVEAVVPRISGDISARLSEDVRSRLASVDPTMREFISGLLHDKKFIGHVGTGLAEAMERSLRAVYIDMVRKELVPAFGRTIDKLMADTKDLFRDGVREVMASVDGGSKNNVRTMEERLTSVINAVLKVNRTTMMAEIEGHMKKMMTEVSSGRGAMIEAINGQRTEIARINDNIQSLKDAMSGGVGGTMMVMDATGNHLSRVNSMMNVASPGSTINDTVALREQKIWRLINAKDFAGALDEALSLTNLRILISVCSRIRTKSVLSCTSSKPSRLPSSSILALIQQLSRDFNDHLDLKIEYLFDAMLSLDTDDSAIREHTSKVLKGVVRRLQVHVDQDSNGANKDKIAMLLRLVSSRLDAPSHD